MGGVLALRDKDRIDEWEMFLRGLGGELEGNGKLDRIKRILLLSYNDLPHYLKSCLLYLSNYPEDYEIFVANLLERWIVLGFVQEKDGMTSTDIAERYLKELVKRSLIQVITTLPNGTLVSCGLHDFLREIIASKSKEMSFTTIATGNYTRWSNKVRHLAIHNFIDNPKDLNSLKSVRSLAIFGYADPLTTTVLSKLLRGPKLLKLLDLYGAQLYDIPKEVFKLFLLKYLQLRDTRVKIIPKSIGKLQNLEVLDLVDTHVIELPEEILKLRKLRSLYVGRRDGDYSDNRAVRGFKSPDGIGKLISLQNLLFIEATSDNIVREIGKLTQMRRLGITKLKRGHGKEFLSSLMGLTNLRFLSICSTKADETLDIQHSISPRLGFLETLHLTGHLERVPQWVISFQALTVLRLRGSGLRKDDDVIGCLGEMPNLVSLALASAYEGDILCFAAGGFRKLKQLGLAKLKRLKWVRVEEDSMPSLTELRFAGCQLMEELPLGLQNLTKLEFLGFYDMSDELIHKIQNLDRESEDYQTISRIPQVCIGYWTDGKWNTFFL